MKHLVSIDRGRPAHAVITSSVSVRGGGPKTKYRAKRRWACIFAGEVLDADTGGYNLQIAFCLGFLQTFLSTDKTNFRNASTFALGMPQE